MEELQTHLDTSSDEFKANRERIQTLVDELNKRVTVARQGGGEKYLARHKEQGKVPPDTEIEAQLRTLEPKFASSTPDRP